MNHLTNFRYRQAAYGKRIAIIGAGIAGLVSGWLLKRAGHDVKIFEANNVVGGRVKTLREGFTHDFYAEAGAMRIPEQHHLTLWLVKALGLNTLDFLSDSALFYINNRLRRADEYKRNPDCLGFELEKHECRTADDLFSESMIHYLGKLHGNISDRAIDLTGDIADWTFDPSKNWPLIKQIDKLSLRDFLESYAMVRGPDKKMRPLSRGAKDFIASVMAYEMMLSTSMGTIVNDFQEIQLSKTYKQIKGGMDNLPRAFVGMAAHAGKRYRTESGDLRAALKPNLSDCIVYNARVTQVLRQEKMRIVTRNPDSGVTDTQQGDFDLVIISIPFSALRHVEMDGTVVTPKKRRAIRQLHYENSCKILLEFQNRFWRQEGITQGGKSITDLPVRQVFYPSPGQNEDGAVPETGRSDRGPGILLASYTWGDDSLRWTSLEQEDRIRCALRDLESIHPNASVRALCTAGVSHSWGDHEFTSGAFAHFEPYQWGELFEDIWEPEGPIHYCGEHTSTKHGWIEGAIESAIRVAVEICERVNDDRDLRRAGHRFPGPN
jgi:monoamine oxidase